MQLAGETCGICQRTIVLAREGKFCPTCRHAVHVDCDPGLKCRDCGTLYEWFEPPKSDPEHDGILPAPLRPMSSSWSSVIMVAATALLLIALLGGVAMFYPGCGVGTR